jgi:hypothetical protein
MLFSVLVPLLIVVPVALGGAPPAHASVVYTVLFSFFATFGAAIPWARDAERGWLERVRLTGLGAGRVVIERTLAGSLLDLLELLPALALIALAGPGGARGAAALLLGVALLLVSANLLGVWVAALARSLAETALLASVTALLALHAAGVFRAPAPGTAADALQSLLPFHFAHGAVRGAAGAGAVPSAAWVLSGAVGALLLLVLTALAAPRLARLRGGA